MKPNLKISGYNQQAVSPLLFYKYIDFVLY